MHEPVHYLRNPFRLRLIASPVKVSQARGLVRDRLYAWGLADAGSQESGGLIDNVLLVVGELLANVANHAYDPRCELLLALEGDVLHIRVWDTSPDHPVCECPDDDEESGRGLLLIDALTRKRWTETRADAEGKEVHCLLDIPELPHHTAQPATGKC